MTIFRNAVFAAIISFFIFSSPATAVSAATLIGKPAPAFDLEKHDTGRLSLASLKGTAVILNFWATWCAPCKAEMPALEAIHKKYSGKGVAVIGMSFQQEKPQVAKFAAANNMTFPIALDVDGKVADVYSVPGLPTTFFIDRDGKLAGYHEGVVSAEMLEEWVGKLREKK